MTEGPPLQQQHSFQRLQRAATGEPPNALAGSRAIYSDSEDSSSSSEEETNRRPATTAAQTSRTEKLAGQRPFEDPYRKFNISNNAYRTRGHVSRRDGRLNISLKETEGKGYLAKTLGATLLQHYPGGGDGDDSELPAEGQPFSPLREDGPLRRPGPRPAVSSYAQSSVAASFYDERPLPRLKIVIMVIGSRGDIQPFLRLGKILKEEHNHRVRIATHPAFKDFVEKDSKLEFFSVGGDPSELMAFMVKNPGLIPKPETIRQGEIGKRREAMFEMFQGFWRACINATDDEHDTANLKMMGIKPPFVADAIIANPPSFAHVHCAERLGVPLHLMFTFPTSPTQQFPHPLANIKQSNVDSNYTNFMSYPLVEMMTWQGLGDLINKFRTNTLGLEPVSTLWAPGQLFRLRVPYSYLWSPGLIPKPSDWGPEIDITGFVFLDLASSFKPAKELTDFLEAGDPPVYIGFGSIVVDDPEKFTSLIFEAIKKAGVRALVSKGWGGLGDDKNTPDNIFMLGNTPHDWLFPRVSAVVHHGGAGSTAIGLKCGKPTMIVPFFGDQPFWGSMVHKAGAGAAPVPYKKLTSDILAEAIQELLTPERQEGAKELSRRIEEEGDGALNAVKSFHRSLPLRGNHSIRCSILEDRVAVWWLKGRHVRLSALTAEILVERKKIKWSDLKLVRHYDWSDFEGPGEPLTGAGAAVGKSFGRMLLGVGSTPFKWASSIKEEKKRNEARKSMDDPTTPKNKLGSGGSSKTRVNPETPENEAQETQERTGESTQPDLPIGNVMGKQLTKELSKNKNSKSTKTDGPIPSDIPDHTPDRHPHKSSSSENIAADLAADTGKGFADTGKAILSFPMDLSLALAQGFHNAPRLWGDDTVRPPTRVTGIKSGLRAAGKEFTYGIYDGWTGVYKHPYHGAKKEGAVGFAKGVGKGLGGFVLKDLSALMGLPAYTLKGIGKEIGKKKQPTGVIRRAHIIQGREEAKMIGKEELDKVVDVVLKGWKVVDLIDEELSNMEKSGLKGKWDVEMGKRKWRDHNVFENVEQTSKALQAQKEGKDFEEEFGQHNIEVDKQLGPRKSAMPKSAVGKTGKPKDGKKSGGRKSKEQRRSTEVAGIQTGTAAGDRVDGPELGDTDKSASEKLGLQHHGSDPTGGNENGFTTIPEQQAADEKGRPGGHIGNGLLQHTVSV